MIATRNYALLFIVFAMIVNNKKAAAQTPAPEQNKWWKEAIVYQLYPRSFKDSNGDGIGDLKGIISKLDYIKSLGVTAVWLNPIYTSPNDDNGYDVSDYRNIMSDFGTMQDFDTLLQQAHNRGIKIIMDLVVNHSSDEHSWFKESRSSRTNKYRAYYHWWNAERGTPPYRYSLFDVGGNAWKYDSLTNAYYLHYFSPKQPDLNWENPALRQEIYDIMHYWARKGIDGFRLDAFGFAAKDTTWPQFPKGFEKTFMKYYSMQGNLHGYLQEMNREVLRRYDLMAVAEGTGNTYEDAHNLVDEDRNELNIAYPFEAVDIAKYEGYSLLHFKEVFSRWDSVFAEKGWLSVFLANHDQARMVSRFGNDSPQWREASAKLLNTFILTMRGTPFCYNGDELGMTNAAFKSIDEIKDMATLNEYKREQIKGGNLKTAMQRISKTSRDNGRTPFQWDASANAGFTTGTPWLKVAPNYTTVNAAAQQNNSNSSLNYFRKATALRLANKEILVYGKYTLLDKNNKQVYAYTRQSNSGEKMLVLLNFSAATATTVTGISMQGAKLVLENVPNAATPSGNSIRVKPYGAAVYKLN